MSEKHDPADGSDAQNDAGSFSPDPSPFELSRPPLRPSEKEAKPAEPPPSEAEPPSEIDAGAQELQARPADESPSRYPDPPKTIVSERVPEWPTWSDGGLPPLIIYGSTPPARAKPNHPDAASPAPEPEPYPEPTPEPDDISTTPEPDVVPEPIFQPAMEERHVPLEATEVAPPMEQPQYVDAELADDRSEEGVEASASDVPTLPLDVTIPAGPAELDEIFDSIDAVSGGQAPATDPLRNEWSNANSTIDSPTAGLPPRDEPVPVTLMGEVPDLPGLEAVSPEDVDAPIDLDAPDGSTVMPVPLADDTFSPESEASGSKAETFEFPDEPSQSVAETPEIPLDAEPELALSSSDLLEKREAVPVGPVITTEVEPSPIELAAIPPEPADAIPITAAAATGVFADAAAGGLATARTQDHDASHGQTAAEFFAHAHEDVERRRGIRSLGILTKFAGVVGLLACVAGAVLLLLACAGFGALTPANLPVGQYYLKWGALWMSGIAVLFAVGAVFWKGWWSSAVLAAVTALVLGGGWIALDRYQGYVQGFSLLSISPYITYAALGGLVVAILGGLLEHRRLRAETHVMAAVFTNLLGAAGGGVLWVLYQGMSLLGK